MEDISDLLGDPSESPDLKETETEPNAAEDDPADDFSDEFPDAEDAVDPDGTAEADDPNGPDGAEIKGGRFAPDSAKVKLDDGTTISVGELKSYSDKRVRDFQRDYSQKTTELSQYAQSLDQVRDFHQWYAETYQLPKAPEPFKGSAAIDPAGYAIWLEQRNNYDGVVGAYQQFQQQRQQEYQQAEQQREEQKRALLDAELHKLVTAYPFLKDEAKRRSFWDQTYAGAKQHYGLSRDEIQSIPDHRVIKVIRDALAYRALKAKAPGARDEAARRPAMGAQGGKRRPAGSSDQKNRQARSERLRATGTLEAGAAALMDLDL